VGDDAPVTERVIREKPTLQTRHRLSAAGALVCLGLATIAWAIAIVRGMPQLLAPIATSGITVWCGWHALTRRGIRRRIYAVATVVFFVATLVGVFWEGVQLPLLGVGVVFLAMALVLNSAALAWVHQPAGRLVGRAKHPVLIVNPRSGDGAAERAGLVDEARARGIKVIELGPDDDLAKLARHAVHRGADCLGMAGGDGSLAVVASQAIRHDIPFVCVPAGTRNHFALDLGLDRSDPVAALDSFGDAVQRRIDTATVNERLFLNNVSIGAYGEVVASEEYRENKVGVTLDRIPDLIGPEAEPLDLRFTDADGERHESAVVIHVSNNAYDLGPLGFGSRPSMDDGALGVVVVVQTPDGKRPRVMQWQAPEFTVDSGAPIASGVDGEAVELPAPLRFAIHSDQLRVRMPRGVAGVSPAAKRPPLTVRTLQRLWDVARGISPRSDVPGR
jgi:diacylglycerol kinase family enzyme